VNKKGFSSRMRTVENPFFGSSPKVGGLYFSLQMRSWSAVKERRIKASENICCCCRFAFAQTKTLLLLLSLRFRTENIWCPDVPGKMPSLNGNQPHFMAMSLFFEIIKFYMLLFATYIEWTVKEGEIDGD